MVKRSKGTMVKRTKRFRRKRKLTVPDRVKKFSIGDTVLIMVVPLFRGLPAPRYHGKHGKIVEKRGIAYLVEVKDGRAIKKLVVSPVHLKKVGVEAAKAAAKAEKKAAAPKGSEAALLEPKGRLKKPAAKKPAAKKTAKKVSK